MTTPFGPRLIGESEKTLTRCCAGSSPAPASMSRSG
jgi:hypothetical protein